MDKKTLDYKINLTITFGAFFQANKNNNPKNSNSIQMSREQLTASNYDTWKKYKADTRYLIYTVTELLQDEKLLRLQFLRQ